MNTILETIRKSKNSKTLPEYTATFRIDGKLRRFHATVRVREGCAISFREPAIDRLLVNNIDQGKKSSIVLFFHTHESRTPTLPIPLGDLQQPLTPQRFPMRQLAAMRSDLNLADLAPPQNPQRKPASQPIPNPKAS